MSEGQNEMGSVLTSARVPKFFSGRDPIAIIAVISDEIKTLSR